MAVTVYPKMEIKCYDKQAQDWLVDGSNVIDMPDRGWKTEVYLATGDSHQTIAFSYRVGRTTVSSIIRTICMEIWNALQPIYLPNPMEEVWRKSEV